MDSASQGFDWVECPLSPPLVTILLVVNIEGGSIICKEEQWEWCMVVQELVQELVLVP